MQQNEGIDKCVVESCHALEILQHHADVPTLAVGLRLTR